MYSSLHLASESKLELVSESKLGFVSLSILGLSSKLASESKLDNLPGTAKTYSFPPVNPRFFLVNQPLVAKVVVSLETLV